MRHLLDHGTDANEMDVGTFGSPLAAAAACSDWRFDRAMAVVNMLLDHGADISASLPSNSYGSALGALRAMGNAGSPRMHGYLLEAQSNASARGRTPSTQPQNAGATHAQSPRP